MGVIRYGEEGQGRKKDKTALVPWELPMHPRTALSLNQYLFKEKKREGENADVQQLYLLWQKEVRRSQEYCGTYKFEDSGRLLAHPYEMYTRYSERVAYKYFLAAMRTRLILKAWLLWLCDFLWKYLWAQELDSGYDPDWRFSNLSS